MAFVAPTRPVGDWFCGRCAAARHPRKCLGRFEGKEKLVSCTYGVQLLSSCLSCATETPQLPAEAVRSAPDAGHSLFGVRRKMLHRHVSTHHPGLPIYTRLSEARFRCPPPHSGLCLAQPVSSFHDDSFSSTIAPSRSVSRPSQPVHERPIQPNC
jgi:hypothetical protein